VEKMKKNREERRAKQQEIMEEKVAQKNVDPGSIYFRVICDKILKNFPYPFP
jgi:hypothetical protein